MLKKEDVNLIRKCFYQGKVHTKSELREKTGISSGGVTNILQELLKSGEILYVSDAASTGGRRSKQYVLNPDHAHIGTVNCRCTPEGYACDVQSYDGEGKNITGQKEIYKDGTVAELNHEIECLMKADPLIRVLVISIPGFCENGTVKVCDFHQLEGKNLKHEIPAAMAKVIENDVNVACIGFFHERKHQNMALIYQPYAEYSGAGLIINGRLYNGSGHKAGELRYLQGAQPSQQLKEPAEQLWREISALQAVADPEVIGWYSDISEEKDLMRHAGELQKKLIHIKDLDRLIEKGLFAIGKDMLLHKGENV